MLSEDWSSRSDIPQHTYDALNQLPITTHPMTQFIMAISSLQTESIFARRYAEGLNKKEYWEAVYEDTMNLIAKLPLVAAYIYRRTYHNGDHIPADKNLDWGANFAHMLGMENPDFKHLMRLYLTIHADHEGLLATSPESLLTHLPMPSPDSRNRPHHLPIS